MNYNINLINNQPKINIQLTKEQVDIFFEMEQLGIDPAPFLAIAANDLFNQYGLKAKDYAAQAIQIFMLAEEAEATEIWQKIAQHIDILVNSGSARMH